MDSLSGTREWLSEAGSRLREIRESRELTQRQVANLLDVTPQAVSLWEAGQRRPDAESIYRMEQELGLPVRTWLRGAA